MLHALPDEQLAAIDESWFVFAVVRHPAARVWSAWQSKFLLREPRWVEEYGGQPGCRGSRERTADVLEDFAALRRLDPRRARAADHAQPPLHVAARPAGARHAPTRASTRRARSRSCSRTSARTCARTAGRATLRPAAGQRDAAGGDRGRVRAARARAASRTSTPPTTSSSATPARRRPSRARSSPRPRWPRSGGSSSARSGSATWPCARRRWPRRTSACAPAPPARAAAPAPACSAASAAGSRRDDRRARPGRRRRLADGAVAAVPERDRRGGPWPRSASTAAPTPRRCWPTARRSRPTT